MDRTRLALAAALAACAARAPRAPRAARREAPPPAAPPPPTVRVAPPPAPVTAPATPWGVVYQRAVPGAVVLAPDADVACVGGQRFELDRGRYRGACPATLDALLPGGAALTGAMQFQLGYVDPVGRPLARASAQGDAVVVAPDSRRVAVMETSRGEFAVLGVPSLAVERRVPIGADNPVAFEWMPDGRIAVADVPDCDGRPCEGSSVGAVDERGEYVALAGPLGRVTAAAFARGGRHAAVVRGDGSLAVIALPHGAVTEVARLALPAPRPPGEGDGDGVDDAAVAVAVDPSGARVAAAVGTVARVFTRAEGGFVETWSGEAPPNGGMTFARDGRTLLLWGSWLAVLREGAAPPAPLAARYAPRPPRRAVRLRVDGASVRMPGEPLRSWVREPDLLAAWVDPREDRGAWAMATEAAEFADAGDAPEAWGRALVARYWPEDARVGEVLSFAAWRDRDGRRAAEVTTQAIAGCDHIQTVVTRFAERDGVLYRVELRHGRAMPRGLVAPWRRAFLDGPLGPAPAAPRGAP